MENILRRAEQWDKMLAYTRSTPVHCLRPTNLHWNMEWASILSYFAVWIHWDLAAVWTIRLSYLHSILQIECIHFLPQNFAKNKSNSPNYLPPSTRNIPLNQRTISTIGLPWVSVKIGLQFSLALENVRASRSTLTTIYHSNLEWRQERGLRPWSSKR